MLKLTDKAQLYIISTALGLVASTTAMAGHCISWPASIFQPNPSASKLTPTYGIEWLKSTGNSERYMPACHSQHHKACMKNLIKRGFYSPHKPTMIFIHGWQPGAVASKSRFDFCYQYKLPTGSPSPTYNTLNYWKGWNVGVFYWNQFADEDQVINAEKKIYTTTSLVGMRWAFLSSDNKVTHCTQFNAQCVIPKEDIVNLAFDAYKNALPSNRHYTEQNKNRELRISGQSLGTQIAIQLTDKVLHDKALPQPTRLTLMDPYFSPDSDTGFIPQAPTDSVAQYNTAIINNIEILKHDEFPIDVYRTSPVSFAPYGNPAQSLMDQVDFARMDPLYLSTDPSQESLLELHKSSIYLYFESMRPTPKAVTPAYSPATYTNARSTNAQIVKLLGKKRLQLPNDATYNFTKTYDEIFTKPLLQH